MRTPAPDPYVKKSPPAWYPDPADNRGYRYWDGWAWTNHFAPRPMEWGPGVDVTYDPPRLPVARLTAGGYEPVVYVWRGDGEPLTPEQAGAAAELERWYRLEQRCDSWWSAPMTRAWLLGLWSLAWIAALWLAGEGYWLITNAALLGAILLARDSIQGRRLSRVRKAGWTAGLSWVVAPIPRRSRRLPVLLLAALEFVSVVWIIWLRATEHSVPAWAAVAALAAVIAVNALQLIGLRRRWWVL